MPWQVTLIRFIVVALLAGGAAALAGSVLRVLARRRAVLSNPEARCGGCGYIVHPGAGAICPECGGGLDQVGVVSPSALPPAFPLLPLWLCCVGATLLAWWAGPRLALNSPWGWDFHAGYQIHTSRTRWVPSMHEAAFGVNGRGFGRGWWASVRELDVTFKIPEGKWITLDVERGGAACRLRTGPRPVGPLPLEQAVPRFVEDAGFDASSEEGARLGKEIVARVRRFLAGDLPPESAGTAGDWPCRTTFDSIRYWPDEAAQWLGGALVWLLATAAAVVLLRAWQRHRRSLLLRDGRRLALRLRLNHAG
jgi:hypothetical protein